MDGHKRIVVGVVGLIGFGILAQRAPDTLAAVLMTFAVVVLVVAMIGFARPDVVRIPNRLASIWLLAVSFGLYLGSVAVLTPPNGLSVSSDAGLLEAGPATALDEVEARQQAARDRRIATMEQRAAERLAAGQLSVEPNRSAPSSGQAAASFDGGTPLIKTGENQAFVMSATWADGPWPFTVAAGNIGCVTIDAGPVLVFADMDGTVWPLNGLAIAHGPQVGGQPSLDPIWSLNPQIPGTRVPLGPIMDAARSLC